MRVCEWCTTDKVVLKRMFAKTSDGTQHVLCGGTDSVGMEAGIQRRDSIYFRVACDLGSQRSHAPKEQPYIASVAK